ncbi:RepB family plasmid replication initiator protein [Aeromonas hydrophila]
MKKAPQKVAWQSNALLNSAYSMSRDEKRLLWLCLSQLNGNETSIPDEFTITLADYTRLFDIDSSNASSDIRVALEKLRLREVIFYLPDEDGDNGERAFDAKNIVIGRGVRPKRGVYTLELNPKLGKFLLGLSREFTKLQLLDVADLRNPHAMRLYENLIQFESTNTFCQRVEWFIERYQLPTSYTRYANFKQKFLDVAVDEINAKTPLSVGYVENKTGRKVTSILFSFSRKPTSTGTPA